VSIASRILISLPSIVWGVVFIGTGSIIHLEDIYTLHVRLISYNFTYCIILPIIYLIHNPKLRQLNPLKSVCAKGKLENLKVKTIFKEKPTLEQKATLTGFTTIE